MADLRDPEVEKWLQHIASYERAFEKWEKRVEKIIKKYRDEQGEGNAVARLNILWSNVQTLSAATFARLPKPDVSRRFKDHDPIGRVASLILERALEYEVDHYSDYRATLKASVLDRFLGGRATAWARYDPKFKPQAPAAPESHTAPTAPTSEPPVQVTEDVTKPPDELDYECAPVDYVHWKDFGHVLARTWEEVPAVWRWVYMDRDALVSRFGEEGEKVPLDAKPKEFAGEDGIADKAEQSRARICEIWDKEKKEARWLSKSLGKFLDVRPDPLGLEEFFPCPKPMYATLANDKLIPTPDYALYQHQAEELDTLCQRIQGLIDAMKVMGVYDASIPALGRVFGEGNNTNLFPVTNWAAFAEKGKLTGAIEIVELKPIYEALRESYVAMEQIKNQIYEITRISDIMRGYVNPREKLGQTEMKGQYGNLGIKAYQEQISDYATELLQIKAQIMCNKFAPETLIKISAADQLSEHDKKLVPQAMMLLLGQRAQQPQAPTPNPMRAFRIEIAADSLIHIDEEAEKESRMAFLQATSVFIREALMALQSAGPLAPALVPLIMEQWKFGVTGFKVGKGMEGAFDEAAEKIKQISANPQAQIPPEMLQQMEEQITQKVTAQVAQENAVKEVTQTKAHAERELEFGRKSAAAEVQGSRDALTKNAEYAQKDLDIAKREADLALREAQFAAEQKLCAHADTVKKSEEAAVKQQVKAEADSKKADESRDAANGDSESLIKAIEEIREQIPAKVVDINMVRDKSGKPTSAIVKRDDGSETVVQIHVKQANG